MKRIKGNDGFVHFSTGSKMALCGYQSRDLLGNCESMKMTGDPVTCPDCARIFCQIKNSPLNEVESNVLEVATYAAVGVDVGPEGVPHDETDYTGTPWEKKGETE